MTVEIKLPRQQRASACTNFGSFPKSTLGSKFHYSASSINKGVVGSFPWNTVVDFSKQAKSIFHKMDTRFYSQPFDNKYNMSQAQAVTAYPCIAVIRNDSKCPSPPSTKVPISLSLETWKKRVQLPVECELWHTCERVAPSLRALLVCPTLRHLAYYHVIVHGSQGWSRHFPFGYLEPADMLAYPSHQVRSVVLSTGVDSWVVAHIDVQMAQNFHAQTGLVPAEAGGLVEGDLLWDTQFWSRFREAHVNFFKMVAKQGQNAFAPSPYVLNRVKFNQYKYHVHALFPGIVFATVPFWMECSELLDQLFYIGE